jgi:hypothetical protein
MLVGMPGVLALGYFYGLCDIFCQTGARYAIIILDNAEKVMTDEYSQAQAA